MVRTHRISGGVWGTERLVFLQHFGFMETPKKATAAVSHFSRGTGGIFLDIYGHSYFWFLPEHEIKRATRRCFADILSPRKHLVYPGDIQSQWPLEQF